MRQEAIALTGEMAAALRRSVEAAAAQADNRPGGGTGGVQGPAGRRGDPQQPQQQQVEEGAAGDSKAAARAAADADLVVRQLASRLQGGLLEAMAAPVGQGRGGGGEGLGEQGGPLRESSAGIGERTGRGAEGEQGGAMARWAPGRSLQASTPAVILPLRVWSNVLDPLATPPGPWSTACRPFPRPCPH